MESTTVEYLSRKYNFHSYPPPRSPADQCFSFVFPASGVFHDTVATARTTGPELTSAHSLFVHVGSHLGDLGTSGSTSGLVASGTFNGHGNGMVTVAGYDMSGGTAGSILGSVNSVL